MVNPDTVAGLLYYEMMKDELWQENDLLCLGILLGSGTVSKKADILFDEWDHDLSGSLRQD